MLTIHVQEPEQLLTNQVNLDLSLNDLRILVTSLNGMAYFGEAHGESYLDPDAVELKGRLEHTYQNFLS